MQPTASNQETIRVEILSQDPHWPCRYTVALPPDATVGSALAALQLPPTLAALLAAGRLDPAIGGVVQPATAQLKDGERLELCQDLALDPKEARRRRVATRRLSD